MRPPATCKSCQAAIFWLKNAKTGHMAPVDALPAPDGNILIEGEEYRLLIPSDRAAHAGRLHLNHFATCPTAAEHARPKETHAAR